MNLLDAVKYTSKVRARQYSTGRVNTIDFKFLLRERQLYVQATNVSADKSRLYKTTIVFEGIDGVDNPDDKHTIPYSSKGQGVELYLKTLTGYDRVRTRCQCQDYYFMWEYFNKQNKALVGPHKKYIPVSPPSGRPPVNPTESPGLCKHLLVLIKKLMAEKVIQKDAQIWAYLTQPPRE